MKTIEVTSEYGRKVTLFVDKIVSITEWDGHAIIDKVSGLNLTTKESYEEVISRLHESIRP